MLTHPTLDKLQALKLMGMYHALLEQMQMPEIPEVPFEERLGLLVDRGEYRPGGSTAEDPFASGKAPANRLYRGYRLSPPTRVGQGAGAGFGHVSVGARSAQRADHRANRYRQNLASLRPGASGLP